MSREFDGVGYYDWPGWQYANEPCFSAWVQISSSPSDIRGIIGKRGVSALFDTWAFLAIDFTDQITFGLSNGAYQAVTGTTVLSQNTWYLVGGQYDGNEMTTWINGVSEGSNVLGATSLAAGGNPYVGKIDLGVPFEGLIENLSYWSRGLYPEEWLSLYEGTSPSRHNACELPSGISLRSHWPMWGFYSDEPSIASDDRLVEQGSLSAGDIYEHQGSPWSVAG